MENTIQGNDFMKPDVPNSVGILVVGIVSLVLLILIYIFRNNIKNSHFIYKFKKLLKIILGI